jgi:hypothetical protein
MRDAVREHDQREGRRQGEAAPRRHAAQPAGARQAEAHADLAARRPGKELAQRHQVREAAVVEPATALHELGAEVAQVRHRPAEGGQAEFQERAQHFASGAAALDVVVAPVGGRGLREVARFFAGGFVAQGGGTGSQDGRS